METRFGLCVMICQYVILYEAKYWLDTEKSLQNIYIYIRFGRLPSSGIERECRPKRKMAYIVMDKYTSVGQIKQENNNRVISLVSGG